MTSKYFEYKDGDYYLKIPNDKTISHKLWAKMLSLIERLKREQK